MSISITSNSSLLQLATTNSTQAVSQTDPTKTVSTNTTSSTKTDQTTSATVSTKWGFKVDENGFFGTDFNKTAEIPANVKIHQKQMETVEQYTKIVGSSDDPVKALGKVWNFFSKVAGSSLDSDGMMTNKQIANMPYSFQSNGSLLDNPVSVQKTYGEFTKVNDPSNLIGGMSQNTLDTGLRMFAGAQTSDASYWKDSYQENYGVTYDSSEASDEASVGEIFGQFCMMSMQLDQTTFDNTKAYYSFIETGQDFKSYLTDKFGADYVKNLADGMNKHFKIPICSIL